MIKNKGFLCFSPPVMLATMAVEVAMFLYVTYRYRLNHVTRIISAILILLALFQLAEFNVCSGRQAELFMHIGFVAITLLPALGLHLIYKIAKKKNFIIITSGYVIAFVFSLALGLQKTSFLSHVCGGNYSIFLLADKVGGLYFIYYYAFLFFGIGISLYYSHTSDQKIRRALLLQVFGYLSFLLPTGIVNTIHPSTINGIPSIMCGFAVTYAVILVFGITPAVTSKSKKNIHRKTAA
ncbi:MAG: hypothetical protein WCG30_01490 [Candidatus Saccharibacteria bacterium]